MTDTEQTKQALTAPRSHRETIKSSDLLSTGSTLLNLACTGRPGGGFSKGKYFFLVGDSKSGKTFLSLTCFAEAAKSNRFDNYRLIYDDVEGGALMDIQKFFGVVVADRLEPPATDGEGNPVYSDTVEDFYFNLDDALEHDQPCIYVLDSMDGLSSKYEGKKFYEKKRAARGGPDAKGDYGDGKAKINSSGIRSVLARLRDTGSILIVVNQTRDNPAAGLFESSKTRSGGHALTFYATLEIWSSVGRILTKEVMGKKRDIGVNCKIHIKKNRFTGRNPTVEIPIYYSHGIDDVGGCVDYLVREGHWKRSKTGKVTAVEFKLEEQREKLVRRIEDGGLERDLRMIVTDVWKKIEAACAVQRKPRY